jgi:hypothetical protein
MLRAKKRSVKRGSGPATLAIDVGGSHVKASVLDTKGRMLHERVRVDTPKKITPQQLVGLIAKLAPTLPRFDRVSLGFPGVVRHGVVLTAPNLGTDRFRGFNLARALERRLGKPVRVENDADVQGLAVVKGKGVEMVITLGSLIADVAHTRPVPITGLASDPELVERLGLSRSTYEGPTGIVGILHDACRRREITSASLWAAVPHYVAAVPNPKAALALLRQLEGLTGIAVEASELEDATERFTEQVDRAVAANPEIEELVRNLEASQEEAGFDLGQNVPSADDIAQEFQRFLRQRGRDKN